MIILLPVGLSLVYLISLRRLRPNFTAVHEATSDTLPADLASEVKAAVDQDPQLKNSPLSPLISDYKPAVAWWYDVAEMGKRLMLTCVTATMTDPASFFLLSLGTAILSVVAHSIFKPMVDEQMNGFAESGHWLVFMVLIMLVRSGVGGRAEEEGG